MSGIVPVFTVSLQPSGWRFEAAARQTVLAAAQVSGIELPSSCRNGTCRACMCRMVSGAVDYAGVRPGLSVDEKAEGWILPCIASPTCALDLHVPEARPLVSRPAPPLLTGARR